MKKNIYLRSLFKDIRHGLGRFIAIILIILMGVLLFIGIKSIGPNLEQTLSNTIEESQLADVQIISTGGLTTDDQALVQSVGDAKVELGYSFPYVDTNEQTTLQLYSYDEKQKQNRLTLTKGHLPENDQQVIVDQVLASTYSIGDTLTIEDDQLTETQFEVVGYAQSAAYIDNYERGVTNVGSGEIDGFAYIPVAVFDSEAYSLMNVRFPQLATMDSFSDEYDDQVLSYEETLEDRFEERAKERQAELQATVQVELDAEAQKMSDAQSELDDGKTQLSQAQDQLAEQKEQLATQEEALAAQIGAEQASEQLADAKEQLATAEQELSEQEATLTENETELAAGQADLTEAQTEVDELATPTYLINGRNNNPGFSEFASLSDQMDAIGNVFPVFFFFIAILITFTTLTRMIEENRKEIGTLKALGYRNAEIASKYVLYALFTALIGTSIGIFVGSQFLPPVVFTMLEPQYSFATFTTHYFVAPIVMAIIAALMATLGATLIVLWRDLQEKPTALLLPKAPKAGKRVFLERVTPIWSRMNFNQKVTYRNLFRYKARMILTILGIAGCTGLMVAGFGLNDSIGSPADIQFNDLLHYQAMVTLDEDHDATKDNAAQTTLSENEQVQDFQGVYSEQVSLKKAGESNQDASLYVLNHPDDLADYVTFNPQTSDSASKVSQDGALISQGLAKLYELKVGDTADFQTADGEEYQVKIAGIFENYLGHSVYLTNAYYQEITGEEPLFNTYLVKTTEMSKEAENQLAEDLLATDQVLNTTYWSSEIAKQDAATESMGMVVLIFIVLSGTLAFVVLYNLTNINISERERELATIKVLGFFDGEVTMYIVRENVIFTFFGILFGYLIGNALTWFIVTMVSSDVIIFPLIIHWQGYLISGVMTFVFSAIVMYVTHLKLRQIHMIEALKSNE
ncbi:MAG: FtsX-like permease family protein [Enterococcus sp.]